MKKAAIWTSVIAFLNFFIVWGVMGVKLFDGDYDVTIETYIGLACAMIGLACLLYVRLSADRCPHCGKLRLSVGKYCPHCGKEL